MEPIKEDCGLDMQFLTRELDKTKAKVFLGNNAAFLGSLMCSLDFIWTREIPTAAIDGVRLFWNPDWFLQLDAETRKTVLIHELWHAARLHLIRIGARDPKIWNYACDIRINNDLENEGYQFNNVSPWLDQTYGLMPEEDIYDILIQNSIVIPPSWNGEPDGDIIPMDQDQRHAAVNNVVKAIQQSTLAGEAGTIPGDIHTVIKQFLAPIIPWHQLLYKFFQDLLDEDYSWRRPNRRYQDMYLPSKFTDDGRLEHLIYYLDVSGSVTDAQVVRFNSEVKYIKDTFNPRKLTLVQFDTRITSEITFKEDDPFEELVIIGRGGTSLEPVRQHIIDNEPTAAIVFSDLYCVPMMPLPIELPVIWVAIGNRSATIPFGKAIYIKG